MKLVVAIIQPEKLNEVKQKLLHLDIFKMTVINVQGCGQQGGFLENYRGTQKEVQLLKKVKLEVAVNDDNVDKTIDAIVEGAKTGNIGDGKIFVLPINDCVRIRTGERGKKAVE